MSKEALVIEGFNIPNKMIFIVTCDEIVLVSRIIDRFLPDIDTDKQFAEVTTHVVLDGVLSPYI